jgi:lipoprotein-anchoring transpeptidase ErfK/SrfK
MLFASLLASLVLQAPADLDGLFTQAERDPAAVVPLIERASERLGRLDGPAGHALAERLAPYAARAFLGPERLPGMERLGLALHPLQRGELPGAVARRNRIGPGLLAFLNERYDERKLRAGQQLKVLDLASRPLQIVVDRSNYRLAAWRGQEGGGWTLVAYWPVGLGAPESPTPPGRTRVVERVRDPEWTHPVSGEVIPPRDPRNLLGGYWIALDAGPLGKAGIGLHGFTGATPADWIEQPASNGCVRLRQADVERLFHLALEGTPVTILE